MLGDCALANAALEVLHGHYDCIFVGLLAHLNAQCSTDLDEILDHIISSAIAELLGLRQPALGFGLCDGFRCSAQQGGRLSGPEGDVALLVGTIGRASGWERGWEVV